MILAEVVVVDCMTAWEMDWPLDHQINKESHADQTELIAWDKNWRRCSDDLILDILLKAKRGTETGRRSASWLGSWRGQWSWESWELSEDQYSAFSQHDANMFSCYCCSSWSKMWNMGEGVSTREEAASWPDLIKNLLAYLMESRHVYVIVIMSSYLKREGILSLV